MFLYPGTVPPSTESCGQNAREARVRQQEDEDHQVQVGREAARLRQAGPHPHGRPRGEAAQAGQEGSEAVQGEAGGGRVLRAGGWAGQGSGLLSAQSVR